MIANVDQGVCLSPQPAKLMQVDDFGIDVEHVAVGAPGEPDAVADRLPEGCPKSGHVDGETFPCLWRGLVVPQPLNQRVSEHNPARGQQEHSQDTLDPGSPEVMLVPWRPQ